MHVLQVFEDLGMRYILDHLQRFLQLWSTLRESKILTSYSFRPTSLWSVLAETAVFVEVLLLGHFRNYSSDTT